MSKRIFDLFFSLIVIVILIPVYLIIALLIKITMKGTVFFIQERVGGKGRIFKLLKFRSMRNNESSNANFEPGNVSRITKTGKFLRKTKLDELPQLFNVLIGDMSIVGPRPEVKKWTEIFPERWTVIQSLKPGITDNASIEFRNEEELLRQASDPEEFYREDILPRKLALYEDYLNNHTFWGDILIIIRTIKSVVFK